MSRTEPLGWMIAVTPARAAFLDVVAERKERIRRQHRALAVLARNRFRSTDNHYLISEN
ncbi:MAG TPA: hypothetical protein VMG10_22990 [Gemmataceae bacterium]|nr:hypothetical protein [Gemmataceae bacterium]